MVLEELIKKRKSLIDYKIGIYKAKIRYNRYSLKMRRKNKK